MTPPSDKPERKTMGQLDEPDIVSLARQRLASHPHFHHYCQWIRIEWIDDRLILRGQLPSFHLKQLAQEALRELEVTIVNQIEVVCADGLSNTQRTAKPEQSLPREPR